MNRFQKVLLVVTLIYIFFVSSFVTSMVVRGLLFGDDSISKGTSLFTDEDGDFYIENYRFTN